MENRNVDKATFFNSGSNFAGVTVLKTLNKCIVKGINEITKMKFINEYSSCKT